LVVQCIHIKNWRFLLNKQIMERNRSRSRSGFAENVEAHETASKAQLFVASKGGTAHALVCCAKVATTSDLALLRAAMKSLESIADAAVDNAENQLVHTGHAKGEENGRARKN
jgi:hypothetical protein